MESTIPPNFHDLWSSDRKLQNKAYYDVLDATQRHVPWSYAVWDEVLGNLAHKDNHNRSIAAQVLSSLAAHSDPENRILRDFNALYAVTKDERFVTARHALQSLWKVARAGKPQQQLLVDTLSRRFAECAEEKNCTLIRYDIIEVLRKVYDAVQDEEVKVLALALIETEQEIKYRKKYASLWRSK